MYDRCVPLRPLAGNEAKAPPSPRRHLWEGTEQPRVVSGVDTRVMDFEQYAAFFALCPERQIEVAAVLCVHLQPLIVPVNATPDLLSLRRIFETYEKNFYCRNTILTIVSSISLQENVFRPSIL